MPYQDENDKSQRTQPDLYNFALPLLFFPSCADFCDAESTASINVDRRPRRSSSRKPAAVVPPGLVTASLNTAGCEGCAVEEEVKTIWADPRTGLEYICV